VDKPWEYILLGNKHHGRQCVIQGVCWKADLEKEQKRLFFVKNIKKKNDFFTTIW
jgi:hypothetical protein